MLGFYAFICPVLDSKQDSLQFSAVLLLILSDTWPVLGTFSIGQNTQELQFLKIFRNSTMFNHVLFVVTFQIDPSVFTWSKLLSYLTICSVYMRNLSVPMLLQHLLFLSPFCPHCSVGQQFLLQGQCVCAGSSVDVSIKGLVQPSLVQLAVMSPSCGTSSL